MGGLWKSIWTCTSQNRIVIGGGSNGELFVRTFGMRGAELLITTIVPTLEELAKCVARTSVNTWCHSFVRPTLPLRPLEKQPNGDARKVDLLR